MEVVLLALVTIAVAVWIGAIVFQSAVVAPVVFVKLDEAGARVFLRTLFPRLFKLGLACGAVMAVSLAALSVASGWSSTASTIALTTGTMVVLGAASLWMVPRINAARDAGSTGANRFERLHRVNVALTLLVLLLGIFVLFVVAQRATAAL